MTSGAAMSWRQVEQIACKYGWHVDHGGTEALLLTGTRPRDFWAPELALYDHDLVAGCVVVRVPLRGWFEPVREVQALRASNRPDPRAVFEDDEITLVAKGAML